MAESLDTDRYCIACGYNLRALTSDRCPECGLPINTSAGSSVPWEGRKQIGFVRSLGRTFWEGAFGVRRLASAVAFPVSASSARRFRLIVAILAALAPSILLWVAIGVEHGSGFLGIWPLPQPPNTSISSLYPRGWEAPLLWSAGATLLLVLPIGFFLTVLLGTGLVRFWMHAHDQSPQWRDRAASLSAYLSSPLILMFLPTLAAALVWITNDSSIPGPTRPQMAAIPIGLVALLAIMGLYLVNSLRLMRFTTHCGWPRLMAAVVGVPLSWLLALAVGMGLFPMLVGLIWVMIDSLRR